MPNIQIAVLVSNSGAIMWISYSPTIVVISMVFLITSMEASIWLCIKLHEGPRSNFRGISSISLMRNPKNIETELNRQPDKYRYRSRYQHRLDFFQGCNPDRPLYRGVLCAGAGIKWSNRHRLGFSQGCNPARPLYRGVLCPGAGIKRSTNINCVFSGVTRTGHVIERVWGLGHCTRCQVARRHFVAYLEAEDCNFHVHAFWNHQTRKNGDENPAIFNILALWDHLHAFWDHPDAQKRRCEPRYIQYTCLLRLFRRTKTEMKPGIFNICPFWSHHFFSGL